MFSYVCDLKEKVFIISYKSSCNNIFIFHSFCFCYFFVLGYNKYDVITALCKEFFSYL